MFGGRYRQLPAVFASDENLIRQAEKAAQVFEGAAVTQGLIVSGDRFVHSSEVLRKSAVISLK